MSGVNEPDDALHEDSVSSQDDTLLDVECASAKPREDRVEAVGDSQVVNTQQAVASTTTIPDIVLAPAASDDAADKSTPSPVSSRAVGSPHRRKVASTTSARRTVITPPLTVNDDIAHEQSKSSVCSETVDVPRRRNPSRNKRRHFSDQWSVPSLSKVYCVCRKTWKGEAMIQCERCDVWYHCSCLQIDPIVCNKYAGQDIQFLCGHSGCNNGNMFLKLPDNTESCDVLLTSGVALSNDIASVSGDERGGSVSDTELVTAGDCESMTTPCLGDSVLHSELVLPGMLHCVSCGLWYNCTCAKIDTADCSKCDCASVAFLCGKNADRTTTM